MGESINIVIVTYNNRELLKSCVASVESSVKASNLEGTITLVDNASQDGTRELIRDYFPHIRYIANSQNLGLTRSLNRGIREGITCSYTMLLNDDVELFPDTISSMIDTLHRYQKACGVPACLIYPDGSPQRVKLNIVGVQKKIPNRVKYVRFAGTTACLYVTEIFRELGLFDEFYFFYNEDLDYSLRAKRNGKWFVFNPNIKVIHHRKKGRKKAEKSIKPYFYATDYYFYRKNYGRLFSSVYFLMAVFHIYSMTRRYRKRGDKEKLELLEEAKQKLMDTVRNFRNLVSRSSVR